MLRAENCTFVAAQPRRRSRDIVLTASWQTSNISIESSIIGWLKLSSSYIYIAKFVA